MTTDETRSWARGAATDAADQRLAGGVGVIGIVFLVVSAAAPLGVVAGTMPVVFLVSQSYALPLHAVIVTCLLLVFSVGYTKMSRRVRNPGAFYSYVQAGLGRTAGVGAATLAVVSYVLILIASSAYLGVFAAGLFQQYSDIETPWWVWAVGSLVIVAFMGYREIEVSAKTLGVFVVLEVIVILVFEFAVVIQGGAAGLTAQPLAPAALGSGSLGLGLMFAIFGFIGFEATAVFRAEARDPDITVPRATFAAVLVIGAFYALALWVIVVAAGVNDVVTTASADPANMVIGLAGTYVGPVWGDVVQAMLVTSTFAAILSFHNVIARYMFTLACRGLLPQAIGVIHERHRAPSNSSFALSVVTVALTSLGIVSGLDPVTQLYAWFSGSAALGIISLMAMTSLAVVVYFLRQGRGNDGAWSTLIAPILALVGLVTIVVLVLRNFELLLGSSVAATVAEAVLLSSFFLGGGLATYFRHARPERYARLNNDEGDSVDA